MGYDYYNPYKSEEYHSLSGLNEKQARQEIADTFHDFIMSLPYDECIRDLDILRVVLSRKSLHIEASRVMHGK